MNNFFLNIYIIPILTLQLIPNNINSQALLPIEVLGVNGFKRVYTTNDEWPKASIKPYFENDYVLISLYVDDRKLSNLKTQVLKFTWF